jgi:hypothetical protein
MSTSGRKSRLALALLLAAGCGARTQLNRGDGAAFVDDDPWLKIDGGGASPSRPADAGAPSSDGRAPDGPAGAMAGGEEALRLIAKVLWENDPDPRHLALARSGAIRSAAELEKIVREMLADTRAERGVGRFYRWWLHLDQLATAKKDPQLFPIFPKVVDALAEDVVRFGVGVTLKSDGRFSTLMTATRPFEDMGIIALVGDAGDDPARRPGLLARPGFLALHARPDRPSPTQRGLFIRREVMCDQVPPSPPGVNMNVPPQPPGMTNREQYVQLMVAPPCVGCHQLIDRIGYGLENYDAVGAFRSVDHDKAVDASGVLPATAMGDLTFRGPAELGKLLPSYIGAQRCIVQKWYEFLRGTPPASGDALFASAQQTFGRSGGDMREVIVTILGATPL